MDLASLYVFDAGRGPAVVLLHGLPSPPEELEELAAELLGMRVLVPHLPGYGKTPAAPGSQGTEAIEAALVRELAARDVDRPVLVGYSMGGYRALSLALAIPARAVVTLGGLADLSPDERTGMKGFAGALRQGIDLRAMLPERFLSAEHRRLHPSDDAIVKAWLDAATPAVLIEELEDVALAPSLLPRLKDLECPVVARAGELDVAVPPSHATSLAKAAKRATVEIVAGAGHALLLEDRDGTVATIRRACAC